MLYTILVIVQVVVALALVALILLQHGKGADAGAAFGSGASGTVFGAKGTANFMSHATAGLATVFMLSSLTLAYLVNGGGGSVGSGSVTDQLTQGGRSSQSPVAAKLKSHTKSAGGPARGGHNGANNSSSSSKRQSNSGDNNNGPKIPD